jgi:hypothetical protein
MLSLTPQIHDKPPILFKDIPQESWDKAAQRAQKTGAAILIVHPYVLDDGSKNQMTVLLKQTMAPVIALAEAHKLTETKKWLISNNCIEHVLVPTFPGWPYPFISRDEYNNNLSDVDLADAIQQRVYRRPNTLGQLETSSSTPSTSAADYGHKQLITKLGSIGVEKVFVAGGYYSGLTFGCVGIALHDFGRHFGADCVPTNLICPKIPENAVSTQQVIDDLTLLLQRHSIAKEDI